LTQAVLVLTNLSIFIDGLHTGLAYAWLLVILKASQSFWTSFFQFVLLPFFAYTQLYLLPWPGNDTQPAELKGNTK
jgi:hypothetical protein